MTRTIVLQTGLTLGLHVVFLIYILSERFHVSFAIRNYCLFILSSGCFWLIARMTRLLLPTADTHWLNGASYIDFLLLTVLMYLLLLFHLSILRPFAIMTNWLSETKIKCLEWGFSLFFLICFTPFFFPMAWINNDWPAWLSITSDITHSLWGAVSAFYEACQSVFIIRLLNGFQSRAKSESSFRRMKWLLMGTICADWIGMSLYFSNIFFKSDKELRATLTDFGSGIVGWHVVLMVWFYCHLRTISFPKASRPLPQIQLPNNSTLKESVTEVQMIH